MISFPVNSAEQLELVKVGLNYKFAMQEVNDTKRNFPARTVK